MSESSQLDADFIEGLQALSLELPQSTQQGPRTKDIEISFQDIIEFVVNRTK